MCLFRPWGVPEPIQAKKSTKEINSFGKIQKSLNNKEKTKKKRRAQKK